MHMCKRTALFVVSSILLTASIVTATYTNYRKYKDIDRTKIPEKVEASKAFQKWITNAKNKKLELSADDFAMVEENEIYNTKWMSVYNIDEPGVSETFQANIAAHKDIKGVVFSPSDKQYIDYRAIPKDGYAPNEIHYYGLREDKLVDARLLNCADSLNCYFDRAYFLDNDVFVISEFSRNLAKESEAIPTCSLNSACTYTVKLHVIDLNRNSRLVYESKPFDINLFELIPKL